MTTITFHAVPRAFLAHAMTSCEIVVVDGKSLGMIEAYGTEATDLFTWFIVGNDFRAGRAITRDAAHDDVKRHLSEIFMTETADAAP